MVPGTRLKAVCILGNINPCENKAKQDNVNHLSSKANCPKIPREEGAGVPAEAVLQTREALADVKRVKLLLSLFLVSLTAAREQLYVFWGQL